MWEDNDLSPIWAAALKSPIVVDRPAPINFNFRGIDYLAFRPLSLRSVDVAPLMPEPNFAFNSSSFGTWACTNKEPSGFKKPKTTPLEDLRVALTRCYLEDISEDRMQSVWNFELTQSVMDD